MDIFEAIKNFVEELWNLYGSKGDTSPLALYRRFITKINPKDEKDATVQRIIEGFKQFFATHLDVIKEDKLPKGASIKFGNTKIQLEIQKYIYKASDDQKLSIKEHLFTINALIKQDDASLAALEEIQKKEATKKLDEKIDTNNKEEIKELTDEDKEVASKLKENTTEEKFVKNIITKTVKAMDTPSKNPLAGIMGLLSSGVLNDLVDGIGGKKGKKEMDVNKLMATMQGAIGTLMEGNEEKPKTDSTSTTNDKTKVRSNTKKAQMEVQSLPEPSIVEQESSITEEK